MVLKNKKISVISLALAILIAISSYYYFGVYKSVHTVSFHADYKSYATADDLYKDAELIVIGRPTEAFNNREHHVNYYSTGATGDFYTITNINVEKVIKGTWDTSSLDVIEPVSLVQGLQGQEKLSIENYTEMKQGSKYIIFLKKNTNGQYSVINMQSGKFNLDQTDSDDFYASVDKSNVSNGLKEEKSKKEKLFQDIKEKYLQ